MWAAHAHYLRLDIYDIHAWDGGFLVGDKREGFTIKTGHVKCQHTHNVLFVMACTGGILWIA